MLRSKDRTSLDRMTDRIPELEAITQRVVSIALREGATAAECTLAEADEFSVDVRMGEIEKVSESGSKGVGVRVLCGQNSGSSYTSDLGEGALVEMVRRAMELAKITTPDPFSALPDAASLGSFDSDLGLYHDDVGRLEASEKVALAKRAEKAALDRDPRITNSDGASFSTRLGRTAFSNSLGFSGSYRTSSCALHVVPVALSGERMERDHHYSVARSVAKLEEAEAVGHKAAERVLRRLNPRKVPTQTVPVVFEQRVARSIVGHIFELINGEAVYKQSSFLAGKLGERVASANVTVIDDSTIPGLFGSSPFDDEGLPARRTAVIHQGILQNYLLNTYTGRKLGFPSTGNASRGITGNATVGHGNLYLEGGVWSTEDLLRRAGSGFYVTELMGFGFNAVTGDYSRGASGLWIQDGLLAFPVSEVTIASNFGSMLEGLEMTANDLDFQGSVAAPTLLIREMTVSGT
jgi:PmbA protein